MLRFISLLLIAASLLLLQSCEKEYSFEGGNYVPNVVDSTPTVVIDTPFVQSTDSSYVDPVIAPINTWHFTDSLTNVYYEGNFNRAAGTSFTAPLLVIWGTANTSVDTVFGLEIYFENGSISPGIYSFNNSVHRNSLTLAMSNAQLYGANWMYANIRNTPSYITIVSYNEISRNVIGSFHCWAYTASSTLTLIRGSFNCVLP